LRGKKLPGDLKVEADAHFKSAFGPFYSKARFDFLSMTFVA